MKLQYVFCLMLLFADFLTGCSNCEKLHLTQSERDWVNHFKPGQRFYYKSANGQIDTLEIKDTSNDYTPCNKFELSEYQYETYLVRSVFKSHNEYDGKDCLITLTKNKKTAIEPEIIVGGLGTIENSSQRPPLTTIDTTLGGVKYNSLNYFKRNINSEIYGGQEYLKGFFWDKQLGLVAYTTVNDEVFIRINR
jgi:hypothetical protein